MSKQLGQNFLVDPNSRQKILDCLSIEQNDRLWEIGPGIGAMTHMLVPKVEELTVFEIDKGFIRILEAEFGDKPNFHLVSGDFLKTWVDEKKRSKPDKILGNLPYNIASGIITDVIEYHADAEKMVFTIQTEVAQRLRSIPKEKNYGSLSVFVQSYANVTLCTSIGAGAFFPKPKVESTVVTLTQKRGQVPENRKEYSRFLKAAFSQRRKKLSNSLQTWDKTHVLGKNGINCILEKAGKLSSVRAQEVSVQEFIQLFCAFSQELGLE